jgi:hypothetical protein
MRYFIDWLEHALKEIFLHHRHNEFAEELTNPHILHLRLERQHPQREHVVAGRLMSYGISSAGAYREPTLAGWLGERREFLTWKAVVVTDRAGYDEAPPADKPTALLTGRRLSVAQQWLASHGGDLAPEERAFIAASAKADDERRARAAEQERQRRRLKQGLVAASFVFLLALLGLVTHRDYDNWTATRPWAFLSHVPDDLPHPLRNKPASIGRKVPDLASLRFDVSLAERDISRLHLLIANDHRAFDQRSLFGTSINAQPLRYGESATLSDGDIVALSGIYAFRYFRIPWQRRHYLSRLLAVGSLDDHLNAVDHARWYGHRGERPPWGALIDGSTRLVHLLSEDAHTVKVSRDGRLTLDATAPQTIASTPDALVMTLNFKRGPGMMPMGCAGLAGGRYLVVEDAREQR